LLFCLFSLCCLKPIYFISRKRMRWFQLSLKNLVMWHHYSVILENKIILRASLTTISDNWNHLMRLRDMKYIGFKHQRENKQNSNKTEILLKQTNK
jgi:hypothetical protein